MQCGTRTGLRQGHPQLHLPLQQHLLLLLVHLVVSVVARAALSNACKTAAAERTKFLMIRNAQGIWTYYFPLVLGLLGVVIIRRMQEVKF